MKDRIEPVGRLVVYDRAGSTRQHVLVGDSADGVRIAEADRAIYPAPTSEQQPDAPDARRAAERAAVRRLLLTVFGAAGTGYTS